MRTSIRRRCRSDRRRNARFTFRYSKARPGASTIPLGEASPHLLAVEQRVGRGRITMLTLNPNDEALLAWPGLDTLVRRVVLRRPEEPRVAEAEYEGLQPGTGRARPSGRHGPELVSHHEPRRRPGDRGPGLALATRVESVQRAQPGWRPRLTRMPTKPS